MAGVMLLGEAILSPTSIIPPGPPSPSDGLIINMFCEGRSHVGNQLAALVGIRAASRRGLFLPAGPAAADNRLS